MITVAGTVIADFFARTLEHEPSRGSLTLVEEIGFHIGGAVPNTGAVLARLGVPVSVVGRIGKDQFGSFVRQELEKWAHTVTLAVDSQRPTTSVLGHIFADGERSFLYAAGASAAFCASDLDLRREQARGSRVLHLGYALLLPQLDGAPMLQVFQQAQELGFLVSLDIAYYPGPDWRTLRELLPFVDVFCPNIREAEAITGQSQPEAAAETLLEHGVRQFVAIKGGERGSYIRPAKEKGEFLLRHQVTTVDSTGAGDAFVAGALAAWHRGLNWREAGRIANATGALAVTKQGATEGIDSWDQVLALLKRENSSIS
jgi:sugar/nucleoside kinase (ribokinase family)